MIKVKCFIAQTCTKAIVVASEFFGLESPGGIVEKLKSIYKSVCWTIRHVTG